MMRVIAICVAVVGVWWAVGWGEVAGVDVASEPRGETPSTRAVKLKVTPPPPAEVRREGVELGDAKAERKGRRAGDGVAVALAQEPAKPARPALATGPRYAVAKVPEFWLPLPTLSRLRPESPVRAHEPVADPMGGTELNVLPIWRTAPAAAHRAQIPDPYEGQIPLMTVVADEDVAAGAVGRPGKVMLKVEEVPTTQGVK